MRCLYTAWHLTNPAEPRVLSPRWGLFSAEAKPAAGAGRGPSPSGTPGRARWRPRRRLPLEAVDAVHSAVTRFPLAPASYLTA